MIQIRNVPDDVHRTFQSRAALAGQSLQEYLLGRLVQEARRPTMAEIMDDVERDLDTHLDTFLIDVENRMVELTWRATQRIPRKIKRLKKVIVRPGNELPEEIVDQAAHDLMNYRLANNA